MSNSMTFKKKKGKGKSKGKGKTQTKNNKQNVAARTYNDPKTGKKVTAT